MQLINFGKYAAVLFLTGQFTACHKSSNPETAPLNAPVIKSVTKDIYMSGKKFCSTYKAITSKEFGKYIQVPVDYNDSSKGTLEIYAYTMSPFDLEKPSYIYVDGGPGQNTHGMMPDYLYGTYNEIRFDQRGLACSSPETWEQYIDGSIYSSLNNINDMDLIRKSYQIKEWSVYGVSYGTVPATMYGSKFPLQTKSVVLEGVVGNPTDLHDVDYKVEKMNLALKDLNSNQLNSFSDLIMSNSKEGDFVVSLFFKLFYSDGGMRRMKKILNNFFNENGEINHSAIKVISDRIEAYENLYPHPQQPGAVDERILTTIYCKNLGLRNKINKSIGYTKYGGFTSTYSSRVSGNECDAIGVKKTDESFYKLENNLIVKPVYYFQGSHDGATLAKGAKQHWLTIPQGASYFIVKSKGGHNPMTNQLTQDDDDVLEKLYRDIFKKSFAAVQIDNSDFSAINSLLDIDLKWHVYTDKKNDSNSIDNELKGILLQPKGAI